MKRSIPFEFVIEALEGLPVRTNPMFGCEAVYIGVKIVFVLREKNSPPEDDGLWLATDAEYHESLKREFPSMRSISVLGGRSNWQVVPSEDETFESLAFRACALVRKGDVRIGRIPKPKPLRKKKTLRGKAPLKAKRVSKGPAKSKTKRKAK